MDSARANSTPANGAPANDARVDKARLDSEQVDKTRVDKARLDAVFGETLPESTNDDARGRGDRIDEDWWRAQRPPHHG